MPKGVYPRKRRTYENVLASLKVRLEQKSEPVTESGCIIFLGHANYLGYGIIRLNNKTTISAHRASYLTFRGEIPRDMEVRHKCDVRSCVNPSHLELGTHAQNMRDMVQRGRSSRRPGELHPNAKLTDELVKEIRSSTECSRFLARRLGFSYTTIKDVRSRRSWRHVA
jgi:hypothetical protein